ncbi:hypothetical protein NM688_g8422 [Phlebia brevispora]|uniref:Uncharacterized protein n=1 Tax=Phlebia brevispora TaxID=194682 RepID=A0ACC1RSS8_9APHY|nr:hypothetical protein NM688_g8422 [Phlebia brevispora]
MSRKNDAKPSLSQSSDDTGFMAAMAQQVQSTWQKKKKENEEKFLQTAKKELEKCGASRAEEFTEVLEEMQAIYEQFAMDYAKAEDSIRAKWQQLLDVQEKCLQYSKNKHTMVVEADKAREKGQVKGMAISKKAVEGDVRSLCVCWVVDCFLVGSSD